MVITIATQTQTLNDTLNFYVPIDTVKTVDSDVEKSKSKEILVSGWASTGDRDFQGETVEPIGIDATYLFNNGWIDYEHDTEKVIGAPTENSYVDTNKGLYIEARLFKRCPEVKELMNLYDDIQDSGVNRSLGFSIEGNVRERDEDDPSIIKNVMVTGVALTRNPANGSALLDSVIKSNNAKQVQKNKWRRAYKKTVSNNQKSFEAGYGISPETQHDGGALRPESLLAHITYLTHSMEQLNENGGLEEFTRSMAKTIDERNPEDQSIKTMFLQIMTGVSKSEAMHTVQDEVSNNQLEHDLNANANTGDGDKE